MSTLKDFIKENIDGFLPYLDYDTHIYTISHELAITATFEDLIILSKYQNIDMRFDESDYIYKLKHNPYGEIYEVILSNNTPNSFNYSILIAIVYSSVNVIRNYKKCENTKSEYWDYIYSNNLYRSPIVKVLNRIRLEDNRPDYEYKSFIKQYLGNDVKSARNV